jgi:hypothetical protein
MQASKAFFFIGFMPELHCVTGAESSGAGCSAFGSAIRRTYSQMMLYKEISPLRHANSEKGERRIKNRNGKRQQTPSATDGS